MKDESPSHRRLQEALEIAGLDIRASLDYFTCPDCGRTSYHPKDVESQYCGNCHTFPENRNKP